MPSISAAINLQHTLDSGQIFRYWKEDDGYRIVHGNHAFFVSVKDNQIRFRDIPKSKLISFFRLDDDYSSILKEMSKDTTITSAIKKYPDLRLLRQDPWECTISFLCSSATNIPRIKRDLENIARTFGCEKEGFYLFPKIGEIDNLNKIKKCGTGFRARYLYEANNTITPSFFTKLKQKSYEEAKAMLMELPGIGPKVADCILLFSLDHLNAFPIDVWMEKVLRENYRNHIKTKKANHNQLHAFAQNYFKPYAGYAQQFLYHWRRML